MGWSGLAPIKLSLLMLGVNMGCLFAFAAEPIGDPLHRRPSPITQYFTVFACVDWAEFDRLRTGLDPGLIALPADTRDASDDHEFIPWLYEQQHVIADLDQALTQPAAQLPPECNECEVFDRRDASVLRWMRSFSNLLTFDGQRCAAEEDWDGFAARIAMQARLSALLLAQDDHTLPWVGWAALERVDALLTSVLRQGYAHRFTPLAAAEIQNALGSIDREDPGRFRGRWRGMIVPRLHTFQGALAGADPVNAYAELVGKELSSKAIFPDIPFEVAGLDEARRFRDQTVARAAALSRDDVLRGLARAIDLTPRVADAIERQDAESLRAAVADAESDPSGVVRLLWAIDPLQHHEFCERLESTARRAVETMDQILNSVNKDVPKP
jgi:hypothetical protein